MRELGLHPDAFFIAPVAILERHVFKAVTARLAGAAGWSVVERAVVCALAVTDEGDSVLIGVVPWTPGEGDDVDETYVHPREARERRERRFLAEAAPILPSYPDMLPQSVIFCVASLVLETQEQALVALGIPGHDARALIEAWRAAGEA